MANKKAADAAENVTQDQMADVIRFQAENMNRLSQKVETVTDDTVLDEVLSESDGTKNVFRLAVGISFKLNKMKNRRFPSNWMSLTVRQLAQVFVPMLIFLMMALSSFSQKNFEFNFGASRDEFRNSFLKFAVSYIKAFDTLLDGRDYVFGGAKSAYLLVPDLDLRFGSEEALSSLSAKITLLGMFYKTTTVSGLITPNTGAVFHTVPISAGFEADQTLSVVNVVGSIGYVPWYQTSPRTPGFLRHSRIGVFAEFGRRIKEDSLAGESLERMDKTILRVKGSAEIDTKELIPIGGVKLGLIGKGDAWYDAMNGVLYHRVQGILRMYLTNTVSFDLNFQSGEGAPFFFSRNQAGFGLQIAL